MPQDGAHTAARPALGGAVLGTIWGRNPFTREQTHHTDDDPLPVTVLNHATSRIYDFERIPFSC